MDLEDEKMILTFHRDLDRVVAAEILKKEIKVILNAADSLTGDYPNYGPKLLLNNNCLLIDKLGADIYTKLSSGDQINISGAEIYRDQTLLATGRRLDKDVIADKLKAGKKNLTTKYNDFITNTLYYAQKEKELLEKISLPQLKTELKDKIVFILIRGAEYLKDLTALLPYLRQKNLVVIGVDGAANALVELGEDVDIIIGDMDSVKEETLQSGAEILVHSYFDGRAPGLDRVNKLGLEAKKVKALGTSEDAAMLLAYYKEAKKIITLGSHNNVIDFFDKQRAGMASTFLVRSRIGHKLVDLTGINQVSEYLN